MTAVMELNLADDGDEALLVPFRRDHNDDHQEQTVNASQHHPRRATTISRFFRRRFSNEQAENQEQKSSLLAKTSDENWRSPDLEQRRDEALRDFYQDNKEDNDSESNEEEVEDSGSSDGSESGDSEDSSESGDSGEETDDEESEQEHKDTSALQRSASTKRYRHENKLNAPRTWGRHREQNRGLLEDDEFARESNATQNAPMQGFGSAPALADPRDNAIGRLLRRIVRRSDLKTMKIATEDTKDKRTLTESLASAVAVAVAPDLVDDEDQQQTLGYYSTIAMDVDEEEAPEESVGSTGMNWRNECKKLIARVEQLELDLKSTQLEAMSWRKRSKELESELRKSRGEKSDYDSSDESAGGECESEAEESAHVSDAEEQNESTLVDLGIERDEPQFDPLSNSKASNAVDSGDTDDLLKLAVDSAVSGTVSLTVPDESSEEAADKDEESKGDTSQSNDPRPTEEAVPALPIDNTNTDEEITG